MPHQEDKSEALFADHVERALKAFRLGDPRDLERLVADGDDSGPQTCSLLGEILDFTQWESAHRVAPPERAGEYRIGRLIGRGGMAVVYEARQLSTNQTVALKLMLPGSGAHVGDARLQEREVRSLGRLKHPNIATLYDAGRMPDGRSYFAMEYVDGRPLSEAFPEKLGEGGFRSREGRRRIALVRDVCLAMSYAHQRGVIHCDLKPSNILVDWEGRPKILDFGLAKMLDPDASLVSITRDRNRIAGTIAYMSPEQAHGFTDQIDTRTDVYCLGVILYELLTGRRPYDLKGVPFPRAMQMICDVAPVKPSTIDRRLRGDLEIIMLKALEKDPQDRYQSPQALAEDLDRYLTQRPILARPPSGWYQFIKLVARHKVISTLIATLVALLVTSAVVFVRQAGVVALERDHAKEEAARRERINRYLTNMLAALDAASIGRRISVVDVLNRASAGLEAEFTDQLEERATLEETVGRGYMALAEYAFAKQHFQKAVDIRKALFGEMNGEYAAALHQLGLAERGLVESELSRSHVLDALRLRRELFGDRSLEVAESLLQFPEKSYDVRIAKCREAIDIQREILGESRELASSMVQLAVLLVQCTRDDEAEPVLADALMIQERLLGRKHIDVAHTLSEMCDIAVRRGRMQDADRLYREQIEILEPVFLPDGSKELVMAYSGLGELLEDMGKLREAEDFYSRAVEMESNIFGEDGAQLSKNNYGVFLMNQGRLNDALPMLESVYRGWHSDFMGSHPGEAYSAQNLAAVLFELGEYDKARDYFKEADDKWRALFKGDHPRHANAMLGLGRCASHDGDWKTAKVQFEGARELLTRRLGPDHWETHRAELWLGESMTRLGDDTWLTLIRDATASLERILGRNHPETAFGYLVLGRALANAGDKVSAEASLKTAVEIEIALDRKDNPQLAADLFELAKIEVRDGRQSDAVAHANEALRIYRICLKPGHERVKAVEAWLTRHSAGFESRP